MGKNTRAKTVQEIIEIGKNDFKDKVTVAFLGDRFSGKTVHCALIKDVLAKYLNRYTNGEYIGVATEGSDRMNKIIEKLYNGKFPAGTLPSDPKPTILDVFSRSGGSKMQIVLRDMAGEQRWKLLGQEMDVDERLEKIFEAAPIDGKRYGLLTHLIFAKIYIIVIDCSKINKWPSEQAYIKDTILHLFEIKERIGDTMNSRMHSPIAIVFSKYDTLPEEQKKSAKELMDQLPEVVNILEVYHRGNIGYFKSSIDSIQMPDSEIDEAMTQKQLENDQERQAIEEDIANMQVTQDEAENDMDRARQAVSEAMQLLNNVQKTNDPNQIDPAQKASDNAQFELSVAESTFVATRDEMDRMQKKLNKLDRSSAESADKSPEELGISKYRPKEPLSYNRDDYLDLITWLIKMNKQVRGF